MIEFNVEAFRNPALKTQYQLEVSNRFEQLMTTTEEKNEP